MNKKAIWGIIVIVILVLVIIGLQKKDPSMNSEMKTVKIGYFGPFTGPVAGTSGEDIANSVKLAHSLNSTAGTKKIEMVYEDDSCDPKKAASAVQKLIEVDKVDVLISGVCSGPTLAAAPIAESHKIVMLALAATSPAITTIGDYTFRTSASSEIIAPAVSQFLGKQGYKNIAIIFEKADYTVGWKDALKKILPSTITLKAEESFLPTDTDLRTQLTKISTTKPDALVVAANSTITANMVIEQARTLGVKAVLVGNEYFGYPQIASNPKAEGAFGTIYKYNSESPELKKLLSAYGEKYGKNPSLEVYAGLAADGYNVLVDVIKNCDEVTSECIKNGLYAVSGFKGIMGDITIDANGDTKREFTLKKIQGGKLVSIE